MHAESGQIYEVDEKTAKKHGLVPIPKDKEAAVRQMNRHQRRKWAAEQRRLGDRECACCGEVAQGNHSIHRDGFGDGPQVALCDACGGDEEPSCETIWERIKARLSGAAR